MNNKIICSIATFAITVLILPLLHEDHDILERVAGSLDDMARMIRKEV